MHSLAGGKLNTGNKITPNTLSYSATFDTGKWSGDVVAKTLRHNASTDALALGAQRWSAVEKLKNRVMTDLRKIFAGNTDPVSNRFRASEFTWNAISPVFKNYLNKLNPSANADGLGEDRLKYLRDDRSNEGSLFRTRGSLLGDIVNSNISYSGKPPARASEGTDYETFRTNNADRASAVFVGANDGMLHAFHTETGDELFSYIPSWLGPNLSALTNPEYGTTVQANDPKRHQAYVDAPSVVAEVKVTNNGNAGDWKTLLVSGTGAGGSGTLADSTVPYADSDVFALDVTDPANFNERKVMWEFTRADDLDLGQVVGAPKIVKIKIATHHHWFAVVAGGINNYVSDSKGRFSRTGKPALFLLAIDKPPGAWMLGVNYFKVSLPIDLTAEATSDLATGVTNFSALYDHEGGVTDIYVGDLHGALWRLEFAGKFPTDWNMQNLSFFKKGTAPNTTPIPLYLARTARTANSGPKAQPIFAAPTPFVGPVINGKGSFFIVFGTGKYLADSDNEPNPGNDVYVMYDDGSNTPDPPDPDALRTSVIAGRHRLLDATVVPPPAGAASTTDENYSASASTPFTRGCPNSDDELATERSGWYIPLDNTQLVDQAAQNIESQWAAINTKIPPAAGGSTVCPTPGGSRRFALKVAAGKARSVVSTSGMHGAPMWLPVKTVLSRSDSTGRRIRTTTYRNLSPGQGTSSEVIEAKQTVGRLSWREIFDYQGS